MIQLIFVAKRFLEVFHNVAAEKIMLSFSKWKLWKLWFPTSGIWGN